MTVEVTWKSRGPWFKSGKSDFFFLKKLSININFIKRLNHRIYNWYIDGDHLLLRFILCRGEFRKDINDKCIFVKNRDNSQEHVINNFAKTETLRTKQTKELNDLDNSTKNKTILNSIFY